MKKKQTVVKSWRLWNKVPNKPKDADCIARAGDICMKINQVWFLCQRENDVNNIVCFRQPGKFRDNLSTIRAMFDFVYRLGAWYGIRYIRVSGKPGRYDFISRLFPEDSVLWPELICGEHVRYVHLTDSLLKKLDLLRHGKRREK